MRPGALATPTPIADRDRRGRDAAGAAPPAEDSSGLAGWLLVLGLGVAGIVVGPARRRRARRAGRRHEGRAADARPGARGHRSGVRAGQRGTPVVGGGSFNAAPILEPGSYRDTILPDEYLYYGFRLEAGQRLRVTVTTRDRQRGDQRMGLTYFSAQHPHADARDQRHWPTTRATSPTSASVRRRESLVISSASPPRTRTPVASGTWAGRGRLLPRPAHGLRAAAGRRRARSSRSRSRRSSRARRNRTRRRHRRRRPRRRRPPSRARPAGEGRLRQPAGGRRGGRRRRRAPDRRDPRDRAAPSPPLRIRSRSPVGAAASPRTLEGGADCRPHQSGRHHRHEGGGARARRGAAAGALRAPEGGEGRRRRRAGRAAARAQAAPRVRGGLPRRGAHGAADGEAFEATTIEAYLPAELSDEELDGFVADAIAATGASSPRDMGQVIKHVMGAAGGRVDGKRVSTKVKEALN